MRVLLQSSSSTTSLLIATTVHDAQLVEAIPHEPFDLTLDLICTPTRTLRPTARGLRPGGVLWDQLPTERLAEMPILQELQARMAARSAAPPRPSGA